MNNKDSTSFLSELYVTIGQAATLLAVNRATVSRWIREGKLSGEKMGSITLIPKIDVSVIAYQRRIKR